MNRLIRFSGILLLVISILAISSAPVLGADLPDLQPTQIILTTVYANATNTVTVVIANNSNAAASNFTVKLEAAPSSGSFVEVSTKTGNSIAAHNDASYWPLSVSFSWKPTAAGSYSLRTTVDSSNIITESDEANNVFQQAATVVSLSPITVNVRVEGKTATIWSGQVTFSTSTITDKQGTVTAVDHPTALGALDKAAQSGSFSYVVSSAYGLLGYVETVSGDTGQGADGWLYRANWQSPSVAAVDYTLANGDSVLWYYGGWSAQPLKLSVDQTNLSATGNFTATVQAYDGANWNAVSGATVQAGSHLYTTNTTGQVSNISLPAGGYTVSATLGTYDTYIRSNTVNVVVYVPLNLVPGWNFISVPKRLTADNSTTQLLFSSVNTAGHSIFTYNPTDGWVAMGSSTTVSPLNGIWIFSTSAVELHPVFDPNPQQVPPTKQLSTGWNAIGFTSLTATAANSTLASVASNWSTLLGFDAATQTSETPIIKGAASSDPSSESRLMSPWKGYWLYMTGNGQLAAISY